MSTNERKVAIITAAAGAGIGQATARRLAQDGIEVVISDSHEKRTKQVAESMTKEFGRNFSYFVVDVRDRKQVEDMVNKTLDCYSRIDILVNNAGTNRLSPIWEVDDETWDLITGVNLKGTFNCIRAVLPTMIQAKAGNIVNLASVAGFIGSDAGEASYAMTKAGLMGLSRAVAAEVAQFGIRVNAVAPSMVYTEFIDRIYSKEFLDRRKSEVPLGRLGSPEDVANTIAFLASDQASYITGEVICISGGRVMP